MARAKKDQESAWKELQRECAALEARIRAGEGEFVGTERFWELAESGDALGQRFWAVGVRAHRYRLQDGRRRIEAPRGFEWYWVEESLGMRTELASETLLPSSEAAKAALCDQLIAAGQGEVAEAIRTGAVWNGPWRFELESP